VPVRAIRAARPTASAAAEAVERFLDALGLPAEVRRSDDLAGTPRRVAEAWLEDLVDGYRRDPAAVLADAIPSASRELVAVTAIDYHSMCPHHLLPSRGLAHVAYLPGGKLVGFGQIVKLVDALAHRLVLQEELAKHIAEALVEHAGARGAACLLEAEQLCMTVRGEKRSRARAHAEAWVGALARDGAARRRFLETVRGSGTAKRGGAVKRSKAAKPDGARKRAGAARRRR
jgi:GTP cyclohydrolase I